MNLPNKLTVLRVILVPVFLLCMYINFPFHYIFALIVYAAASITDMLDGKIARKRNLVTTFGKFLDPLADKILVASSLISFVAIDDYPGHISIAVILIIAREFMVSGLRLVTASEGVVVAAGIWGKLKTAFTMIGTVLILFFLFLNYDVKVLTNSTWNILTIICDVIIWIATILTWISELIYLKEYSKYINTDK